MPNPTISTITLPSGSTYDIADLAARAAISAGVTFNICTSAANTPEGVTWDDDGTTITGTLEASSDTTGAFYLVPSTTQGGKDIFSEYITVVDGNNYSWEKIGTTDIDLSDLGDLAYKDTASGNYTPAGTVSQPTFTGTPKKFTFSGTSRTLKFSGSPFTGTGNFTPNGSIQVNETTGTGASYTPEGTIRVNNPSGAGTSYAPQGSVSQPTFTGTKKYFKFTGTQGSVSVSGSVGVSGTVNDLPGPVTLANASSGQSVGQVLQDVSVVTDSGTEIGITGSISVNNSAGTGTSYVPSGSISINESTGAGTSYTPQGSVSTPTISLKTAGTTASVTPFGSAGTLPSLTMTVQDGNLTIGFDQGTLPSAGTAVTVKTGDGAYQSTQPSFTGTEKKFVFSGTEKRLAFSGNAITVGLSKISKYLTNGTSSKTISLSGSNTLSGGFTPSGTINIAASTSSGATEYQPAGTVTQPYFTGTEIKLAFSGSGKRFAFNGSQGSVSVTGTPEGTVLVDGVGSSSGTTYTPAGTINVSSATSETATYTPEGTVSQPQFTGTQRTVTVS